MNAAFATITLARFAARKAVKRELQRQGIKSAHIPAREISALADDYLATHRELIAEARERVDRWRAEGVFGKRAQRAAQAPR